MSRIPSVMHVLLQSQQQQAHAVHPNVQVDTYGKEEADAYMSMALLSMIWLTRMTSQSNKREYSALAMASRLSLADSTV
jgi:hypothetical protein